MSGHFTQRGEPSIVDKWQRTKMAIENGVDIVVELPFIYACNGADYFAMGSIGILNALKVNQICFGSEANNINEILDIARTIKDNEVGYNKIVEKYVKNGERYANACNMAINELTNKSITTPNDILGLAYIKEIVFNNYHITPYSIKRTNSFHDKDTSSHITSATSIREATSNNKSVKDFVPDGSNIDDLDHYLLDDYFDLLKYKLLTTSKEELRELCFVSEGIEALMLKHIVSCHTMADFISKLTSKRYTRTRIQRTIIHVLLNHKNEVPSQKISYTRVLGMSKKGQEYLNSIKKDINIALLTNFTRDYDYLDLEFRATCLYASIKKDPLRQEIIEKEFRHKPIII